MSYIGSLFSSDQDIINNLKDHKTKRQAEDKFFNTYKYFIKKGMLQYRLSEDDAFDAYSDSVLAALERIGNGSFKGSSSLKTYLYNIFQHKCVDIVRKNTTNKSSVHHGVGISDMLFQLSDSAKSAIQKLIDQSDHNVLRKKLGELGENCRKLLSLSAEGHTDREISEMMDFKTASVVKTTRLRCLDKLRVLYKTN